MAKVWCAEMCGYVADETVQIFGGAGYVEDYPAERIWRDARINRIYEGTNEINRLLVPGRLIRKAHEGRPAALPEGGGAAGRARPAGRPRRRRAGLPRRRGRHGRGSEEGRPDVPGPRRAEARRDAQGRAGGDGPLRRHRHGDLRARERAAAHPQARCGPRRGRGAAAGGGRALLRPGRAWTRSRPRPAGCWPRWPRARSCALLLAALRRFTKREPCNTVALRRLVAEAVVERAGYPLS